MSEIHLDSVPEMVRAILSYKKQHPHCRVEASDNPVPVCASFGYRCLETGQQWSVYLVKAFSNLHGQEKAVIGPLLQSVAGRRALADYLNRR